MGAKTSLEGKVKKSDIAMDVTPKATVHKEIMSTFLALKLQWSCVKNISEILSSVARGEIVMMEKGWRNTHLEEDIFARLISVPELEAPLYFKPLVLWLGKLNPKKKAWPSY